MRAAAALALAAGLALGAPAARAQGLRVEQAEPRAYGWRVGDVFERRVTLWAPAGSTLVEDSLPRVRRGSAPIELLAVEQRSASDGGLQRHELRLRYQVFLSPPAPRTLEVAPMTLRVRSAAGEASARVEAWPIVVSPLVPEEAPARRGLGELQPDAPPPLPATRGARLRLAVDAAVAALALGWLAWSFVGWPWAQARRRPFQQAWRALRRLPDAATPEAEREALRALHAALNRQAGQVLYGHDLDGFLHAAPQFAAQREALARLFTRSRQLFFEARAPAEGTAWLRELARALRDVERGLR